MAWPARFIVTIPDKGASVFSVKLFFFIRIAEESW